MKYGKSSDGKKGFIADCGNCLYGACHGDHYLGDNADEILDILIGDNRSIICPKCKTPTRGRLCMWCGLFPMPDKPVLVGIEKAEESLLEFPLEFSLSARWRD